MYGVGGPDEPQDVRGVLRGQRPQLSGWMGGDRRLVHTHQVPGLPPELRLHLGPPLQMRTGLRADLPRRSVDGCQEEVLVGRLQGACEDRQEDVRGVLRGARLDVPRGLGGEERLLHGTEDAFLRRAFQHVRPLVRVRLNSVLTRRQILHVGQEGPRIVQGGNALRRTWLGVKDDPRIGWEGPRITQGRNALRRAWLGVADSVLLRTAAERDAPSERRRRDGSIEFGFDSRADPSGRKGEPKDRAGPECSEAASLAQHERRPVPPYSI
mmetsp:Transcript_51918/g.161077  ORF Transcript_51918/g.161077 Transcript_51918/m.161077 type:complete len:268 (+) Transcript_51918:204-1007(+)